MTFLFLLCDAVNKVHRIQNEYLVFRVLLKHFLTTFNIAHTHRSFIKQPDV